MVLVHNILLVCVGIAVGTIGTLIGAGGGFLLVPYLLMIEHLHTKLAVGVSLAVVLFNALSGTIAYLRQKRVDIRTGVYFLISSVPGALLGTSLTGLFTGEVFRAIFGGLLLLVVYRMLTGRLIPLFLTRLMKRKRNESIAASTVNAVPAAVSEHATMTQTVETGSPIHLTFRSLKDAFGNEYTYRFSMKKGVILSFFVGIYSGLFGVGGGILHVPIMVGLLGFPVHIASATSHFILVFTSLASTIQNVRSGNIDYPLAGLLILGIIIGAQIGAFLSNKVNEKWLKFCLASFLILTAVKMIFF